MVAPHGLFKMWTPDEVAECLDGVGNTELYGKLWSFVNDYPCKLKPAEMEEPCPGTNNLAIFWDRLTEAEQDRLNKLAELGDW